MRAHLTRLLATCVVVLIGAFGCSDDDPVEPAPTPPLACDCDTIVAAKDNTMFEPANDDSSNGAGEWMFVGRTGGLDLRRALVQFDISAYVDSGATIDSVFLELQMDRSTAGITPVRIHPLQADWGEAGSDARGQEGAGAPAQTGDATWRHTMFPSTFWTTQGGDFGATSATLNVSGFGLYRWGSTNGMVSDVQGWLDDPQTNFGWIIMGDETTMGATAKRFQTRENKQPSNVQPRLIVYSTGP